MCMAKNPKRPRDPNRLAKMIVDIATGEIENTKPAAKSEAQRLGGLKGGESRAKSLSPERRQEIAKNAAQSRWDSDSYMVEADNEGHDLV